MSENPRIEELRLRVQKDPASIAFAQLAEEYRRAGQFDEAILICRAGLALHPTYLSAHVTLGRSLLELTEYEDAEVELQLVLQTAPENLAAIRGLAEINERRGDLSEALGFYKTALGLARHDPDLEQVIDDISRAIGPAKTQIRDGQSFPEASVEFMSGSMDGAVAETPAVERPLTVLLELERFLDGDRPAAETPAVEAPMEALPELERLLETDTSAVEPPVTVLPELERFLDGDRPAAETPAVEAPMEALPELGQFLEAISAYRQRLAS